MTFHERLKKMGLSSSEIFCLDNYAAARATKENMPLDQEEKYIAGLLQCTLDEHRIIRIEHKEMFVDLVDNVYVKLNKGKDRNKTAPLQSITNYLTIMENDGFFSNFICDELTGLRMKIRPNGEMYAWTDADDAAAHHFLEEIYELPAYKNKAYESAITLFAERRSRNFIQEAIKMTEWDGVDRVEDCLSKWLGAPDDIYTKECSRVLFAQGILRAFDPGCKAECVVALMGNQGIGKSTFVKLLDFNNDDFYYSLTEIRGKDVLQCIHGKFVIEIEELKAIQTATPEQVKQFISIQTDVFRAPYDKNPSHHKRSCVFVSTSNNTTFLTDKTGNRRWLPVMCNKAILLTKQEECKSYLAQCWAEMYRKYRTDPNDDFVKPYPKPEYRYLFEKAQRDAMEEDTDLGIVMDYLIKRQSIKEICTLQLWYEALGNTEKPDKKQLRDINDIMKQLKWTYIPQAKVFESYGKQRYYTRPLFDEFTCDDGDPPF